MKTVFVSCAVVLLMAACGSPGVVPSARTLFGVASPTSPSFAPSSVVSSVAQGAGGCVVEIDGGRWHGEYQSAYVVVMGVPYSTTKDDVSLPTVAPTAKKKTQPGSAMGPVVVSAPSVTLDAAHPTASVIVSQRGLGRSYGFGIGWRGRKPGASCAGAPWSGTYRYSHGGVETTLTFDWASTTISMWPPSVDYPISADPLVGCAANQPRAYVGKFVAPLRNASDPFGHGFSTDANGCMFQIKAPFDHVPIIQGLDASVLFSQPGYDGGLSVVIGSFSDSPVSLGAIFPWDKFPLATAKLSGQKHFKGPYDIEACDVAEICAQIGDRVRSVR
jgi:hypothetical protein